MSLSRSALAVTLERHEIEELICVLQERMYRAADKEEYSEADGYRRRVAELREVLKTPMPAPNQ